MTRIEVLKNWVILELENSKDPQHSSKQGITSGSGRWFPLEFLEALVSEIEELEERCAEKEPQVKSFTVSSDKKDFLNFQKDEFGMRFIEK